MARPYRMPHEISELTSDPYEDFVKKVAEFKPDLLALSATEDMFPLGVKLIKALGEERPPSICGGVFATFAPELALGYPEIDYVCKGEGEQTLLEICKQLQNDKPDISSVPNLCYASEDGTEISKTSMVDMNANPLIDMSI